MKHKSVYPYDYMDNFDKFIETQSPNKKDFYLKLYNENITDEQYRHAQNVWTTFCIKNMGQYHDLYLSATLAKSGPLDFPSEKSFLLFFAHEKGLGHMFQK